MSKEAQLIVVKIAANPVLDTDLLWAFDEVFADIRDRPREDIQPAVVMFPIGEREDPSVGPWPRVKQSMEQMFALGTAIVVAAGNFAKDEGREAVDTVPAIWGDIDGFRLIVAGAVDNTGAQRFFSGSGSCYGVGSWVQRSRCEQEAFPYEHRAPRSLLEWSVAFPDTYGQ